MLIKSARFWQVAAEWKSDCYRGQLSREVKQNPTESGFCSQYFRPALARANTDNTVTKHLLRLLVNRESLAQIKNTTAPSCFLHVILAVSCSTDTAGASICQCNFDNVAPGWYLEYTCRCPYICTHKHTNRHTKPHIQLGKYQLGAQFHTGLTQNTADTAQTARDWPHWDYKPETAMRFHLFFLSLFRPRNFFFPPHFP